VNDASANPCPVDARPAPGSRLQREREKRGWSIVEAAERMHLDPWAIEALEANRFDSVGPSVFAKGHLRQYAIILGVPAGEVLAEYESFRQGSTAPPPTAPKEAVPAMPQIAPAAPLSKLLVPIGGGAIAVAVLAGVLLAWKPWRPAPTLDPAPVPSTGAAGASLAQDSVESEPQPAMVSGGVGTPAANAADQPVAAGTAASTANVQGTGRARLRMSFSADSWVEVREAGGAMVYRGKGAANSVKVVTGIAPLTIYLGYVSGVQLEINSRAVAIGPQFVHGDVAKFDAGADGVLRRSPRT